MVEDNLKSLSKEQLLEMLFEKLDEILSLSKDPKNEEKADEKRDEIQLIRKALLELNKSHT